MLTGRRNYQGKYMRKKTVKDKTKFHCEECSKSLTDIPIMVDGQGLPPLDYCSWECLMRYAIKRYNQEIPTSGEKDVG